MSDPWKSLSQPNLADALCAMRVDPELAWGFFWARGVDNKYMLILQHDITSSPPGGLPHLKGIEASIITEGSNNNRVLALKLLDSAQRELFYKLCTDIVASTAAAATEKEAVSIAITRTWRWHYLLRGGSDGRLSQEEQKGLIGELLVLDRHLFQMLSITDAINTWTGPSGAPKDFEVGRIAIEAKARRGAATPYILINSEYQLDETGTDKLFLHVAELDKSPDNSDLAFSVTDIARRIKGRIALVSNNALDIYENLLYATGFRWEDDYSDSLWVEGPSHLYLVNGDFPRIAVDTVVSGVTNVKYSISLQECQPYIVSDSILHHAVTGGNSNE